MGGAAKDHSPVDNFSQPQIDALVSICAGFYRQFPQGRVVGHKELRGYEASHCPPLNMTKFREAMRLGDAMHVLPLYETLVRSKNKKDAPDGRSPADAPV
jgi:hypothetical protein